MMIGQKDITSKNGFVSVVILIITIVAVAILFVMYPKTNADNKAVDTETLIDNKDKCESVEFVEYDNKRLMKRTTNKYVFDVTHLPEIFVDSLKNDCKNSSVDVDLYPLVDDGWRSVARFMIRNPERNTDNLTLEEYAINELYYEYGTHVPKNSIYINPVKSTKIVKKINENGYEYISWEVVSTLDQVREGTLANKNYVLEVDGNIVYFDVFSWDTPSFRKAVKDTDLMVESFYIE
jgi:hypothetical protein